MQLRHNMTQQVVVVVMTAQGRPHSCARALLSVPRKPEGLFGRKSQTNNKHTCATLTLHILVHVGKERTQLPLRLQRSTVSATPCTATGTCKKGALCCCWCCCCCCCCCCC
jgi:hypothetical protein